MDNLLYQTTNTGKIQGCVDDIILLVRSKFCGTVADIMNDRLRQVCTWCESERLKTKAQGVEGNYKMNPLTKEMVGTPFTGPQSQSVVIDGQRPKYLQRTGSIENVNVVGDSFLAKP